MQSGIALDLGLEWQTYVALEIPRGDFYRCRPEGHNTVIIDPGKDVGHNLAAWGKRVSFVSDEYAASVCYDLTEELAHKGVTSWKRSASVNRVSQSATLRDEVTTEKRVAYYWFMHTDALIDVSLDGRTAILHKEGKQIRAKLRSENADLKFEVMEVVPLAVSPAPPQTVNDGVKKLVVHASVAEKIEMEVEFSCC